MHGQLDDHTRKDPGVPLERIRELGGLPEETATGITLVPVAVEHEGRVLFKQIGRFSRSHLKVSPLMMFRLVHRVHRSPRGIVLRMKKS